MDLVLYTLRSVAYVMVEPSLVFMLILLGIMFYSKNRKLAVMQKMIIGESINSPLELTLSQIVLGLLAGIAVSLIFSFLGITFQENSGIEFLFIVSVILMIIKPRWVCFSYSGAILGFISLIFTYGNILTSDETELFRINIMTLMTFVGVLHIIEAFLVMFDGNRGAIPVFSNKKGKIIGGYALRRNWVIPIAIFIAYNTATIGEIGSSALATPSWWPLLKDGSILALIGTSVLSMFPFFGVLGYSAVTFTRGKKAKAVSSGVYILGYGVILTIVAQVARFGLAGEIAVLVFAPLGHEAMLYIQKKIEEKRQPLYVSGEDGIAVLEVIPDSIAFKAGIKPGYKIAFINEKKIDSEIEIYNAMKDNVFDFKLKVNTLEGEAKELNIKKEGTKRLGIVLVPRIVQQDKVVGIDNTSFADVFQRMKNSKEKHHK